MPEEQKSLGEQLGQALGDQGVSQRELARRMASADGTKLESKRRWIAKLLDDEIDQPEATSLDALARALGLPRGYFKVGGGTNGGTPERKSSVATLRSQVAASRGEIARLESRVEELERRLRRALGDLE